MNWQQLYTASTPEERLELLNAMFQSIEARHNKLVIIRPSFFVLSGAYSRSRRTGWLVRERRRMQIAHFINDRRGRIETRSILYRAAFLATLGTLTTGVWLVALHIPPVNAAQLVTLYVAALLSILLIKPRRLEPVIARF